MNHKSCCIFIHHLVYSPPEKCTGCLICELRRSLRLEKAFNPARARIKIRRLVNEDTEYSIYLTEERDNCGICVRHCPYEALFQEKRKGAD